jgi:hypothetical protein
MSMTVMPMMGVLTGAAVVTRALNADGEDTGAVGVESIRRRMILKVLRGSKKTFTRRQA